MQNFWCKNPQVAAEAVRCRWPKSAEHTIFIADEICRGRYLFQDHWEMEPTHTAVDFGAEIAGIDWAAVPFGDPEWLYAMNRHTSLSIWQRRGCTPVMTTMPANLPPCWTIGSPACR